MVSIASKNRSDIVYYFTFTCNSIVVNVLMDSWVPS